MLVGDLVRRFVIAEQSHFSSNRVKNYKKRVISWFNGLFELIIIRNVNRFACMPLVFFLDMREPSFYLLNKRRARYLLGLVDSQ